MHITELMDHITDFLLIQIKIRVQYTYRAINEFKISVHIHFKFQYL